MQRVEEVEEDLLKKISNNGKFLTFTSPLCYASISRKSFHPIKVDRVGYTFAQVLQTVKMSKNRKQLFVLANIYF